MEGEDTVRRMENIRSAFAHPMDEERIILKSKLDENGWVKGYPFIEPYDQKLRNYFVHRVYVRLYAFIPHDWRYFQQIFNNPNYIIRGVEFKLNDIPNLHEICDRILIEDNANEVAETIYEFITHTLIRAYENPDCEECKDMLMKFGEHDKDLFYDIGAYPTELVFKDYIPAENREFE